MSSGAVTFGTMASSAKLRELLLEKPPEASFGQRRLCGCVVWQFIFFYNVFCACVSFSIVMPSLFLYLDSMGATASFYALVVAAYSFGEAIGSIALGSLSNSFGIRHTLLLCTMLSFTGACLYGLAATAAGDSEDAAAQHGGGANLLPGPLLVLAGRLIQGLGSGGQQAVEQSYLAVAARPEERTSMTGKLATFACMGFIFGPTFGAAVGAFPSFTLGVIAFNAFTKVGWVCAVLNMTMFLGTWAGFREIARPAFGGGNGGEGGASAARTSASTPARQPSGARRSSGEQTSLLGVWALNAFFLIHFNGFAIQETLTTPLVGDWFEWDEFEANLLFTAAGVANLACAVLMSILTSPVPSSVSGAPSSEQRVSDRALLFASLLLGFVGWLVMVPPYNWAAAGPRKADAHPMGLPQFGIGFSLVTICFPFGRGLCLAMVGKLLGDQPQGFWMGLMLALGAIARIVGPFWAVAGYYMFGTLSVFGSCALLFAVALVAMWMLWPLLSPAVQSSASDSTSPVRRAKGPAGFFERESTMLSSPRLISTPPMSNDDAPASPAEVSLATRAGSSASSGFTLPPYEGEVLGTGPQGSRPPTGAPAPGMASPAEGPAKSLRRL